ncbi:P-loop containing nucleoside triphosphate hydrolase protein [Geopyxis carbonaria]|nr:P-loop containing nucleoside triphosphate hydrolase protein [Geopyxis carbonaria]
MKIEVKHLESRNDDNGYVKITEPSSGPPKKDKVDRWREWVLCEVRHYDDKGVYTHSRLDIKSPILKEILKRVIGNYPGISFSTDKINLMLPAQCLFLYLNEIKAECKSLEPESLERKHLDYFVEYLTEEFAELLLETKNLRPQGLITYPLLWTLFKPGCIVYALYQGHPCALRFNSGQYRGGDQPCFMLNCSSIDYDGTEFGWTSSNIPISPFQGSTKISGLTSLPLSLHPEEQRITEKLITRGQKFEALAGINHCHYHGSTLFEPCHKILPKNIDGPVMVDAKTFDRIETHRAVTVKRLKKWPDEDGNDDDDDGYYYEETQGMYGFGEDFGETKEVQPLTEDQLLLCSATVRGFALSEKKWLQFFVDLVSPIEFSDQAFDQLVLPARQKSLVRALVESHINETNNFDDFIKGKGKGLISVLHGPPGVGKTLTAEAVSHVTKRPLYVVSSGELGTDSRDLEHKLSEILDVANVWKAVLLLDEADVFLEKRSTHDLERNALVSVFLRLLEYYKGILILTTNRVSTFDEAFQSRIHIALKYNNLEKDSRKKVWGNFLAKVDNVDISEEGLEALSEHVYNGRQIKNCVRTAKTLADREKETLRMEHIETVLQIQEDFERDLFEGQES